MRHSGQRNKNAKIRTSHGGWVKRITRNLVGGVELSIWTKATERRRKKAFESVCVQWKKRNKEDIEQANIRITNGLGEVIEMGHSARSDGGGEGIEKSAGALFAVFVLEAGRVNDLLEGRGQVLVLDSFLGLGLGQSNVLEEQNQIVRHAYVLISL